MKGLKTNKRSKMIIFLIAVLLIAVFLYWQNYSIVVTNVEYANKDIPENFNGFRILQISDLHNVVFGKNQSALINRTEQISPDVIVITGDLIDRFHTDIDAAMAYVTQAVKIAPVYFVPGNHECISGEYSALREKLTEAGVTVLDNDSKVIEKNGQSITLAGLMDPRFNSQAFEKNLKKLSQTVNTKFDILLCHRPEKMDLYAQQNIDLVIAGHAHGGQIRLPLIGGLFASSQGIFPKYTSGLYTQGNTSMVVSRGLGSSLVPLRVFNYPEMVVVTLESAS